MKLSHNSKIVSLATLFLFAITEGCSQTPQRTLGSASSAVDPIPVQSLTARTVGTPVAVSGEMIEKCPVAGCWFVLKDKSGVVRVDTKGAGFVVSEVPLHSHLIVTGAVTSGAQPGIDASGVRY